MKNLMKTNIYDVEDTILIIGSCLKDMQPEGYKKLELLSNNIYSDKYTSIIAGTYLFDNIKLYLPLFFRNH